MGRGVIIGVLDSGIMPDHPSFRGDGLPGPPSKWKGTCTSKNFCNDKIIGLKKFMHYQTPVDDFGHGTNAAGVIAGNFVSNANVLGSANGTASGVAPHSHLAIYQVCDYMGWWLSNVIRGIDAAIEDGVDVISISADEQIEHSVEPYYDDLLAIATFNAMKRGIFVSCAAGNKGPSFWKVSNDAPWILTIGASTIDRKIKAIVKLDDNREFEGESAFQPKDLISIPYYDDYDCSMIMPIATHATIFACRSDADLDVGHGSVHLGNAVKNNGGVGMIVCNTPKEGYSTLAHTHVILAEHVSDADCQVIISHLSPKEEKTASILFRGTAIGTSPAPTVGYFSSRGPSSRSMSVLKPDIIGPGVSILAPRASSKYGGDDRKVLFDMRTGTSIATAHLSGVVALIKSIHPDWSSAMINSAIMTTSDFLDHDGNRIMDEQRNPVSFFAMGAGHVNPSKAADPGLVYNITVKDYIAFLCGKGYNNKQVELIAHEKVDCENKKKISDAELNYPAIVCDSRNGKLIVNRTVMNVGETNSKYLLKIDMPKEVQVEVSPKEMVFSEINEKKTYTVSLSWNSSKRIHVEGNLMWVSNDHVVRSPIVIVGILDLE